MLEAEDRFDTNKRMEGIAYPICKWVPEIRDLGLNYAFKNSIVGFGNKVELISALGGYLKRSAKV